jgi:putative RecB family exonuclease
MKPLSYTQVNRYRTCPLWYKLQYMDKLKPKERFYLSFGDVIHQCAEYFYKIAAPPPPSLENLLQFYEKNWLSRGYETPQQEQQYKEYGRQLLKEFWTLQYRDFKMPLAVEQQFYLTIADGIVLGGKIDRVDKLAEGLSIVDYKTNQNLFTGEQLNQDLQLTFYQLAVESMWKIPVTKLTLYHLRSNTACTCEGRRPDRLAEARQMVLDVAAGIQQQIFPATENSLCAFCDFPQHCPYHKHEYAAPEPLDSAACRILLGKQANEVVEQYAALQSRKKEIEAQIDVLRQQIAQYCDSHEYKRIFGSQHAISYKMVERTGFDEEKVRAVLEPTGLWPRVLKYDPGLVKDLLEADYLNADIRKKLSVLKQVTSSFSMLTVKKLRGEED